MQFIEKYDLELKEKVTKTFLKTVSAFSNYNSGEIIFGITDDGNFVKIENIKDECLTIENMINDSITPAPDYILEVKNLDGNEVIVLRIKKGKDTPYYYNGKAYKRSDTASVETDKFELRRLSVEGMNIEYEEKRAFSQELKFTILEKKLKEEIGISKINLDILKTLELYNKDGFYNIAAELLSDKNEIKFAGINIVKFGDNINQILFRETQEKISLLSQYDRTMEIFEMFYRYEEIEGYKREKRELIPREAFRESVANAIVHRVWDVNANIKISMKKDEIEIISPGGLPKGISQDEYLYGNVSLLRNPIIAEVFHRINLIEKFGTGIARINDEYKNAIRKPEYIISENFITIKLPIIEKGNQKLLLKDELVIYNILKSQGELTRKNLEEKSGQNKPKTVRTVNSLIKKNIVKRIGDGPSTTYKLK